MSRSDRNSKKSSGKKKILIGVLVTFLTIIIGAVGGGFYYVNHLLNKVEKVEVKEADLSINPEIKEKYGDIKNIALFGIDSVDGVTGRSDSIMLLTLDSMHNKIKLTSVMRDSYVNIPGRGMDKINHAYAFGGPELAIKTLNENFNLDIKDFMSVNFSSMPIIIDKIGGVNIEITDEEVPHIAGINAAGNNTLSGEQALSYARIRYAEGGDYKRTERQRTVINAIFAKVTEISITQYPQLISDFLPLVQTNMSSGELIGLSKDFASLATSSLEQERFPRDEASDGQMIDGVYYLTFDIESSVEQMHKWIFEDIR
ncbi:MAG: LCP family protein [Malacoplasma sp.]